MILNLVVWLLFGSLAGWIVWLLTDDHKRLSYALSYIFFGAIGTILGGFAVIFLLGAKSSGEMEMFNIIFAIPFGLIVLGVYRATTK